MRGGYRKIQFTDYRLSEQVKGAMNTAIMKFDANGNALFEQDEIVQALVTILKEDENQVYYFIQNVFRYDRDNDGKITPQQFVNFCLEQHFGEMAIQRLHRKGYYSRGAERVMNLSEFQNTLNYCLGIINSPGTHYQYEICFSDVDNDGDGLITYQEYFMFLKQYFGSQSPSIIPKPEPPIIRPDPKPEPKPEPQQEEYLDMSGLTPEEKLARLVYTQLKMKVMDKDFNKNLTLQTNEIDDIISNVFKLGYTDQSNFESNVLGNPEKIQYDDFMKKLVVHFICEIDPKKNMYLDEISEQEFVSNVQRATSFIDIKPSESLLKKCFKKADTARGGKISKNTYINTMKNIFQLYLFDKRGLPRRSSMPGQYI